jgi:hypothetical protein
MSNQTAIRSAFAAVLALLAVGWCGAEQEKGVFVRLPVNARDRRDLAKEIYEMRSHVYLMSPIPPELNVESLHDWSVRWMQAERDMSQKKVDHITALEDHLKRMQFWKDRLSQQVRAGDPNAFVSEKAASFFCLEAKELLAEASDPVKP